METRLAGPEDVARIVTLAAEKRLLHSTYQPQFWNPSEGAEVLQDGWFRFLLTDPSHQVLVTEVDSEVVGFIVGRLMDAPPVYDPGGKTCMVDDFVAEPGPLFSGLLEAMSEWALGNGASQLVVVTAAADSTKRAALLDAQLSPASEWWVKTLAGQPLVEPQSTPT